MNQKLNELAMWTKFISYVLIIGGIINAIAGVFMFVVGAIPGVITAIMGFKLLSASKNVEAFSNGMNNEQTFYNMISDYASYFKINGILVIISIVIAIIMSIVMFSAMGAILSQIPHMG